MPAIDSLISDVVQSGFCCGCGVCAGICPKHSFLMTFNAFGEYNPVQIAECIDCKLCLKSCPFMAGNLDEIKLSSEKFGGEKNIKFDAVLGHYLTCYCGYAAADFIRWNGSSGGVASVVLTRLIGTGMVDYVITVRPTQEVGRLYEYEIFSNIDGILKCSKSAYYPVELSTVIHKILNNDGRYAVVGLPCVIKAVELAKRAQAQLRKRIKFTIGLVCGGTRSKGYTEYLAKQYGGANNIVEAKYREKEAGCKAGDYGFKFIDEHKRSIKFNFLSNNIVELWTAGAFSLPSCSYCDDVFSETADIVFMDAWLPEFSNESRGTSLVIVRDNRLEKLIADDMINATPIDANQVRYSQERVGVVNAKREGLAHRLVMYQKWYGKKGPQKRIAPKRLKRLNGFLENSRQFVRQTSRQAYADWCTGEISFEEFNRQLKKTMRVYKFICWFRQKIGSTMRRIKGNK